MKKPAAAGRKPNSVRLRSAPCGRELRRDDHSSSPAITGGIKQPTRRLRTGRPLASPYLALLRAGFCLPPMLPPARCALTAPFHPYLPAGRLKPARYQRRRYVFCATSPSSCPDRALPGALPCGVRTFLSPTRSARRDSANRPSGNRGGTAIVWPTAAEIYYRHWSFINQLSFS